MFGDFYKVISISFVFLVYAYLKKTYIHKQNYPLAKGT